MIGSHLLPAAKGLFYAEFFSQIKTLEGHSIKGQDYSQASLFQAMLIGQTISVANKALAFYGRNIPNTWTVTIATFAGPKVLSWVKDNNPFSNRVITAIIDFSCNHLGTVAELVTIVSLGVMFAHGKVVYSVVALSWIGINAVIQNCSFVPKRFSHIIRKTGGFAANCSGLVLGSLPYKIFTAISLIDQIFSHFRSKAVVKNEVSEKEQKEIVATVFQSDFTTIFDGTCTINPHHFKRQVIPYIPTHIYPKTMLAEFDAIKWSEFNGNYTQAVISTRRKWLEEAINMATDKETIKLFPSSYVKFQYYLRFVAYKLSMCEDNVMKARMLDDLVTASQKQDGIKKFFFQLLFEGKTQTLKSKILVLLQLERLQIFDGCYRDMNALASKNDWLNLYQTDLFSRATSDSLGIPCSDEPQDLTGRINGIMYYLIGKFAFVPEFLQRYEENTSTETVLANIGTIISIEEIRNWWNEWIERRAGDEERKKRWAENFAQKNNISFFQFFTQENEIHPLYIQAMLIEMGVLTLPQKKPAEGMSIEELAVIAEELEKADASRLNNPPRSSEQQPNGAQ